MGKRFVNQFYSGSVDFNLALDATPSLLKPGAGPSVAGVLDIDVEHAIAVTDPLPLAKWFSSGPVPDWAKTCLIIHRWIKTTHNNSVAFDGTNSLLYARSVHPEPPGGIGLKLRLDTANHIGPQLVSSSGNGAGGGGFAGNSPTFYLRGNGAGTTGERQDFIKSGAANQTDTGLPPADEFIWTSLIHLTADVVSEEIFTWETWAVFGE